jgi:cell division protein FtsX|tara:strand:+ start:109 stop:576 length:468 start_codon:yes stop_codon:yes gene_type:complete
MAKTKRKVGRPKFEITEAIMKKAEDYAAKGLTAEQIAMVLGISETTFYERQAENAEFAEALKRGRGTGIANVTNALYEKATVDKDNTAMIFYLKNRAGWVDKQETTTTVENRHVIDLTGIDNESLKQLESVLEQSITRTGESREVPKVIEGVHES